MNEATRNQLTTSGIQMADVGVSGIGGSTNIITRPSQLRKGFRASVANGNATYRFRGMLTYATGLLDNGWSFAVSLSTRQGGNSYTHGVYSDAYGYYAAAEKQFIEKHRIRAMLLCAPTARGVSHTAIQDEYVIEGNN